MVIRFVGHAFRHDMKPPPSGVLTPEALFISPPRSFPPPFLFPARFAPRCGGAPERVPPRLAALHPPAKSAESPPSRAANSPARDSPPAAAQFLPRAAARTASAAAAPATP